jgi:hypothetical protein
MSNNVLKAYTWIRSALIAILIIFLFLLNLFAVTVQPYDYINTATKQMTRSQAMVKDVLILSYRRDHQDDAYTNAASELQGIFPIFQQEETRLQGIQRSDLKTMISAINSDYSPMVSALKTILPHVSQPIDPLQLDIILQHEHSYLISMNQIIMLMLQDLDSINQEIFTLSTVMLAIIMILTVVNVIIMVIHARNAQALHIAASTINPITTARNEEV